MSTEPNRLALGALFADRCLFRVHSYQRDYAWRKGQVQDFCRDIARCHAARKKKIKRQHFFGGLISVETRLPKSNLFARELVDGQQRLATLVLYVARATRMAESLAENCAHSGDTSGRQRLLRLSRKLRDRYLRDASTFNMEPVVEPKLELSGVDRDYFAELIKGNIGKSSRASHKRLRSAVGVIDDALREIMGSGSTTQKADNLSILPKVLGKDCNVLDFPTRPDDKPHELFQVLNARGTALSAGDLLRATTLGMLQGRNFEEFQREAKGIWDDILRDTQQDTTRFLMWYYSAKTGRRPQKAKLLGKYVSTILEQEDETMVLQRAKARLLVKKLRETHKAVLDLRAMLVGIWPWASPGPAVTRWDTERLFLLAKPLKQRNCMPLLLAARRLGQKRFAAVVSMVERFIFRYKSVCNHRIGPATGVFHEHAKKIQDQGHSYDIKRLRSALRALLTGRASEANFRQGLSQLSYGARGGNRPLKYLLLTLEDYWRWFTAGARGTPVAKDKVRSFDFEKAELEHIYPQKARPPWRSRTLEKVKHTLGNITILGRDDQGETSNNDFAVKKAVLKQTGLWLNKEVAKKHKWGTKAIDDRQKRLIEAATKIFVP